MHTETTAFISDQETRAAAGGRQRWVRHTSVPDSGPTVTWDHAEPYFRTCPACQEVAGAIGEEAFLAQLAKDAPDAEPEEVFGDRIR
jgi:hypothetical protein